MILLELSDFNGFYRLAQSIDKDPILEEFIERFEAKFIRRILGVELGDLLIADVTGEDSDSSTIEARFQVLLDPLSVQEGSTIYESVGLKKVLAGLIYCEYMSSDQAPHSQSGVVLAESETSTTASPYEAIMKAEEKWNSSLHSLYAIQWYCGCKEYKTYPEYSGLYFRPRYAAFL